MAYLKNTTYLFLPFRCRQHGSFRQTIAEIKNSGFWSLHHDEFKYMLKYVAEKINSQDEKKRLCFHYFLKEESREAAGLGKAEDWFVMKNPVAFRGKNEYVRLQILNVQLFYFNTTVGIMAFKVHFEKEDPYWISNALYYLKKVAREKLLLSSKPSADQKTDVEDESETVRKMDFQEESSLTEQGCTMMEMAHRLMNSTIRKREAKIDFFYYNYEGNERANFFTYLEADPYKYIGEALSPSEQLSSRQEVFPDRQEEKLAEARKRILYYLRRAYSDGYFYQEDSKLEEKEIFSANPTTSWGLSPEGAVCLTMPQGDEDFVRGKFYENINSQYMFMYVLLLHQKYVLYLFLMLIGVGMFNDLERLEDYRQKLYEFETDYVFSCVTEVPQYQNLYDRLAEILELKVMFEDVHEPLVSLAEVRRSASEKEQKKRDDSVENALRLLGVLAIFSALVDSFDFIGSFFGLFMGEPGVRIFQILCILGIAFISIRAYRTFLTSRKHDEKKTHRRRSSE